MLRWKVLMDRLPFDPIELHAVDPARNVHRRWRVVASRDLFGRVVVETGWGRTGTAGRRLLRSFGNEADALLYVRGLLSRRGTARRRLGVGYAPWPG